MKILNLFAGIGGNRTLWGDEHEITAIEYDQKIAMIYHKRFPKDQVLITNAYEYCLWNYDKFDFIWGSPPCPSHSQCNCFLHPQGKRRYPDMGLWQLIIFLNYWCTWKRINYVIENVKPYYKPIIKPSFIIGRHYFWSNLSIPSRKWKASKITILNAKTQTRRDNWEYLKGLVDELGFDLNDHSISDYTKRKYMRNCVDPQIGKIILSSIKTQNSILNFVK